MQRQMKMALGALAIVLVGAGAGVMAYFALAPRVAAPPGQAAEAQSSQTKAKETSHTSGPGQAEEELAAKARQAAEAKAAEGRQEKSQGETQANGMTVSNRQGLTFYTYDYPRKPAPGVYLRPFVISDGANYELKFDLYYFYSIDDAEQTAWIHGDALEVNADGAHYTLAFDPHERRDKVAKDVENLAENYVETATSQELAVLKAVGQAQNASIYYYRRGSGDGRAHELTTEEKQRIHNMVAFYESVTQGGGGA